MNVYSKGKIIFYYLALKAIYIYIYNLIPKGSNFWKHLTRDINSNTLRMVYFSYIYIFSKNVSSIYRLNDFFHGSQWATKI